MNLQNSLFPDSPRCLVIAEVAQSHDGSLGTAHAFIDAAARAGVDAIKFQTHIAAAESTPSEPWRVKFSRQDETRYDYWKRMEFSAEHWSGLADHAREAGLIFLSSAFSVEAVDLLDRLAMPAWKIASGEVASVDLFDAMAATGKPFLLSTGMSSFEEIDRAVDRIRAKGCGCAVFQCTSKYPTPAADVGLNVLPQLAARYGLPIGLSDHSGTIFPGLAAVPMGIEFLEVHATFDRSLFGPDQVVSLTFQELTDLVRGVRFLTEASANPVDKDAMAEALSPMRALFNKSVVAVRDLDSGAVLTAGDLAAKKPGGGLPASELPKLVGSRLTRAVSKDTQISEDMLS